MQRKAFLSFHFERESLQATLLQQMRPIRCNRVASPSEWNTIKARGDDAIIRWIDLNMRDASVVVVLIGEDTSKRKWVRYEIEKGWQSGRGILGIYAHNLAPQGGRGSIKGDNPFRHFFLEGKLLSRIVESHDPPDSTKTPAYRHVEAHLADWVETAILIRSRYPGWQRPR